MYRILPYTKRQANKIGVEVKPSKNKGKKIDVFRKGKKIASVGAIGYNDYPTFLELERKGKYPKGHADKRRKAYKQRHNKNRKVKWSNGWLADQLLW
jgi:hypothetical protein